MIGLAATLGIVLLVNGNTLVGARSSSRSR